MTKSLQLIKVLLFLVTTLKIMKCLIHIAIIYKTLLIEKLIGTLEALLGIGYR